MSKRKYLSILLSLLLVSCAPAAKVAPTTQVAATVAETAVERAEETVESTIETSAAVSESGSFDASSIPVYNGEWYVTVNNNIPFFSESDVKETSSYTFSQLDSLGRCGVAEGVLGKDLMPTGERGNIGMIKPSGWQTPQQKYDFVDGKYLYNRCHLIGWQFLGDVSNVKENLITGTRSFNTIGMLPFENKAAEYIRNTGHHVLYRVTPIFEKDNLVAEGVLMEAKSVEDAKLSFCVFVYNVEPGVDIDYATGKSALSESANTTETVSTETSVENTDHPKLSEVTDLSEYTYIVNINSKKIHKNTCESAKKISRENRRGYNGDIQDLLNSGFIEAKDCF